ncbi:hypothetical protein ABMA27_010358 [Loxostege sticticalis]|uniref:DUF7869 domain-containing protein n=1 Tax=Loxostege sticticalis TaxID=481309 RepID=A0ABR3H5G9_LOXSC
MLQENPCKNKKCIRKCFEISEERRKSLFDYFWTLNDEKKLAIKRKKTKNTISRRSTSYEYFINEGEGRRQVCQQFILKTLDISQTHLLYSIYNAKEGLSSHDSRDRSASDKFDENTKAKAKAYIESLPALPSHYKRKKSNKLYLPEQFRNLSNLYRLYVKHCQELSEDYLSDRIFSNTFREYNFAFHIPKKDKCTICTKNENNPDKTTNKQLQEHLVEKEATYKRFHIHRHLKPDPTLIVASFDLQKVLATPHGESMMLYYSRKYAVYNFTVYGCRTQNGYCYTWGEADGRRGSCEIATCLFRYLKEVDTRGVKTLIFYCDNCTGQNKNRVILSMLNHFLQESEHLETIQINYLLPGHTYMETKNLIVWAPSQWPTFMESARKRPKPYKVEVLEHTDVINFNEMSDAIFTPVTIKNKNLRLKQIRVCTFKKSDLTQMHVKYSMKEDSTTYVIGLSKTLQEKGKGKCSGKENHRQAGEAFIIPKIFHNEYLNLPNITNVKDTLNESDNDDCEED